MSTEIPNYIFPIPTFGICMDLSIYVSIIFKLVGLPYISLNERVSVANIYT